MTRYVSTASNHNEFAMTNCLYLVENVKLLYPPRGGAATPESRERATHEVDKLKCRGFCGRVRRRPRGNML